MTILRDAAIVVLLLIGVVEDEHRHDWWIIAILLLIYAELRARPTTQEATHDRPPTRP